MKGSFYGRDEQIADLEQMKGNEGGHTPQNARFTGFSAISTL